MGGPSLASQGQAGRGAVALSIAQPPAPPNTQTRSPRLVLRSAPERSQVTAALSDEADARTRTGDPFITSEVLYQLSYVGRRLL